AVVPRLVADSPAAGPAPRPAAPPAPAASAAPTATTAPRRARRPAGPTTAPAPPPATARGRRCAYRPRVCGPRRRGYSPERGAAHARPGKELLGLAATRRLGAAEGVVSNALRCAKPPRRG